jgi:hypothetical protein
VDSDLVVDSSAIDVSEDNTNRNFNIQPVGPNMTHQERGHLKQPPIVNL